jgi:hypothetical protein
LDVSIQGTTREMSSKSMSPPVRRVWKVCCSQVVPHLPNGVMTTSVGLGRYDLIPSGKSSGAAIRPRISFHSAMLRARRGAMASISDPQTLLRGITVRIGRRTQPWPYHPRTPSPSVVAGR